MGGLAVYLFDRFRKSNALDELPRWATAELGRRSAANKVRTDAILQEAKTLTESFTRAGVQYAILKGVALLPDYCPDPALRTQYDHDVLVDAASLSTAERVLQVAGYQRKQGADGESTIDYRRPDPALRFTTSSEGLYSARLGRSIELHLQLWEEAEDKVRVTLPGDFLQRRQLRHWGDLQLIALSDEDCLLFQILHAFRHILRNWCRLSIFLEIACFLERNVSNAGFWERFARRIGECRWAAEASFVVFTLAEQLFGGPVPPILRPALRTQLSPTLNLWIERYGRRSALSNFRGDKSSLFLHREFVDSPAEWAAVRSRRLFPLQRPHKPPAIIFQRGFSKIGRVWMENVHALRRLGFHGFAGIRYAAEYPRWEMLRRMRV
jgi:hypothetical protein